MLVAGRHVRYALRARQGPGRDARRGQGEAFVLSVCDAVSDQGATVDRHIEIEVLGVGRFTVLGEQQIRGNEHRTLILLGQIESLNDRVKAVHHIGWCQDSARIVAL